jgi:hypothetical protein
MLLSIFILPIAFTWSNNHLFYMHWQTLNSKLPKSFICSFVGIQNRTLRLLKLSWLRCNPAELQHGMLYKATAQTVSCKLSNPSTRCSWHNSGTCHCQLETIHSTNRITVVQSQESSVGVVTRLQAGCPRNCASIPSTEKTVSYSPKCQDWLWHPDSLLFQGHTGYYRRRGQCNTPPWHAKRQHYLNIVATVAMVHVVVTYLNRSVVTIPGRS